MKKENRQSSAEAYLPPQEQLIIGAKVNRLCEATPDTFDSSTQVSDAQVILNALSPRIRPQKRFTAIISSPPSSSEVKNAVTSAGNINVKLGETNNKYWQFGVSEYRIGNYVAVQILTKQRSYIYFEHFWDRGENNIAFNQYNDRTEIEFDPKSLEIKNISIAVPAFKKFGFFYNVTYTRLPLWSVD